MFDFLFTGTSFSGKLELPCYVIFKMLGVIVGVVWPPKQGSVALMRKRAISGQISVLHKPPQKRGSSLRSKGILVTISNQSTKRAGVSPERIDGDRRRWGRGGGEGGVNKGMEITPGKGSK